jgi:hypothetical protein
MVSGLFQADDLKTKRILFVVGSFADSAKDFVSILANGSERCGGFCSANSITRFAASIDARPLLCMPLSLAPNALNACP